MCSIPEKTKGNFTTLPPILGNPPFSFSICRSYLIRIDYMIKLVNLDKSTNPYHMMNDRIMMILYHHRVWLRIDWQ